jgi:GT2 family glycosyltransferase
VLAVVLNYNGTGDTIRCVEWLAHLAPEPPSIIVVDNASDVTSVAAIRAAQPHIEVLELPTNLGFSGGNNRGIQHAVARSQQAGRAFDFVWLINNDTYGDHDALSVLVARADADEMIGAVGSVLVSPAPERMEQSRGTQVSRGFALTWNNHARGGAVNSLCGASMLIRTTALEQVGLLDETFFFCWEDADLCQRLLAKGWKLAVADDSPVTHKEGASAAAASPFRIFHHVRGIVLFARRHSPVPWFSATFATLLCTANCAFVRRRPELLTAVWTGFVDGWKTRSVPVPAWPFTANAFTPSDIPPAPQDA